MYCVASAENPEAHPELARKTDLPRSTKAAGRAECSRIRRAEDQAVPDQGSFDI